MSEKILAINNAFSPTLIAYGAPYKLYFSVKENPPKISPNNILFIVDELLKAISMKVSDIDAVSVVNGPGSFTGTRVSVVEAKIIAYTLNIPLVAINSLALIGKKIGNGTVILNAGRGEFFYSQFKEGKMVEEIRCGTISEIKSEKMYSVGLKNSEQFKEKNVQIVNIEGEDLIQMSAEKLELGDIYKDPLSLNPVYLRSTDILFKKRKK